MRLKLRILVGIVACLAVVFWFARVVFVARAAARESGCHGRMFWLGALLRTYEQSHGSFPPSIIQDVDGKPLYSGLVLSFADNGSFIHNNFRLDLPWDAQPNAIPVAERARVTFCPNGHEPRSDNSSSYVYIGPRPQAESKAAGHEHILLFECPGWTHSWAEPIAFTKGDLGKITAGGDPRGLGVFFADGTFQRLPPAEVRELVSKALIDNSAAGSLDVRFPCPG